MNSHQTGVQPVCPSQIAQLTQFCFTVLVPLTILLDPTSLMANQQIRTNQVFNSDGSGFRYTYYLSGGTWGVPVNHGLWESFFPGGALSGRRNYVNGLADGEAKVWYPNGQLKFVQTYDLGVLDGPFHLWYESGKDQEVGEYVDGGKVRSESWLYWESNGQMRYHVEVVYNLETRTSWFEDGQMQYYEEYIDGLRNGLFKSWEKEGGSIVRRKEIQYLEGRQHGLSTTWDASGHKIYEAQFEYGQILSSTDWRYSGNLLVNETPKDGDGKPHGVVRSWTDPSGTPLLIAPYTHGLLHGVQKRFWKTGQSYNFTEYRNGKKNGANTMWFMNGSLALQEYYINDLLEGPATTYCCESCPGVVSSEYFYHNGKPCGTWTEYRIGQDCVPHVGTTRTYGECPSEAPGQPDSQAKDTNKRISGRVYDAKTSSPIVGATVGGTLTSSDGSYSITIGTPNSYTLTCSKTGYDRFEVTLNMEGVQTRTLNIRLKKTPSKKAPSIIAMEPAQPGVYFFGTSVSVKYEVNVQWNGLEPDSVIFEVGRNKIEVPTTASRVSQSFDMGAFPFVSDPDLSKNRIKVTARSKTGEQSRPEYFYPAVIPLPSWAQSLGPFLSSKSENVFTYAGKTKWPQKPIRMSIDPESLGSIGWAAWSLFPIIGGRVFGIPPSQFFLDTEFKSDGKGSLAAGGTTAFMVADGSIAVKLGGKGYALFKPNFGMELQKANVLIGCEGSVTNGVGVITVIPALERAVYLPVVGRPLSWFNSLARIEAKIYAGFDLEFPVWAKQAELAFASANLKAKEGITLGLVGEVKGEIRGELGGDGELVFYFQTPPVGGERYLTKAEAKLGGQLLLQVWSYQKRFAFEHWWVNEWTETPQTRSLRRPEIINRSYELDGPGFVPISARSFAGPNYNSFVANRPAIRPLSLSVASGSSETVLIRNVYPYSDPAIAALDNRLAVAYVTFNTNQPAVRATDIALTYSATGGQYSVPLVVTNDTCADFSPAAAFANSNTVVVVWQRVKDPNFSETNDIPEMAKAMEIAWAAYNVGASKWGPVHRLTDNDYLDHSPRLSRSPDGTLLLSWVANSGNEMIGTTNAPDRIWSSFWDSASGTFAELTGMTRDLVASSDYRIANDGRRALLAYAQDLDGILYSTNAAGQFVGSADQEIFVQRLQGTTWSEPVRITTNAVADSAPMPRFDSSGKEQLFWLSGSNLVMRSGLESATQSLVRESSDSIANFRAIARADDRAMLVFQGVETNGMDLYYRSYDPVADSWSEDRRLTQDPPAESDFEGAFASSNRLCLVYLKKDFSTTNTDLCLLNRSLTFDIAIAPNGLRCDPTSPMPGQPVTVLCNVTNRGDLPVSGLTASFHLGTTNAVPLTTLSLSNTVLRAGAATDLVWRWTAPADTNTTPLLAVVKPGGLVGETDLANNSASLSLFLPDLEILDTRIARGIEGRADAVAVIRNRGAVLATNLFVRFDAESRLLGVKQVPDVLPGNIIEAAQSFSPALDFTNAVGSVAITVDPDNLVAEFDETNNKDEVFAFMREDTNENGIPDWWEQFHFGKLVNAGEDADGDGLSNLQEFWTQTSPADPMDYFRVQASPPVQGGTNFVLSWNPPLGWQYSVYLSTNLGITNGWRLVGAGVSADEAITFTNRPYFPQQFYKVLISP